MTEPTDAELMATFKAACGYGDCCDQGHPFVRPQALRAVLRRWGQPAVAGEPMTARELADRVARGERWRIASSPQPTQAQAEKCAVCGDGNARLVVMRSCDVCGSDYAGQSESEVNVALERARKATQTQAGAVPLTDEQIAEGFAKRSRHIGLFAGGVRFAEQHHGIKGGQHG